VTEVWRCDSVCLLVSLHTRDAPTDDEWKECLDLYRRVFIEQQGTDHVGGLAVTDGGAPNSKQRGAVKVLLQGRRVATAVVSESVLVRSAVTALHWFNRDISVFPPSAMGDAVRYVGVPVERNAEVLALLKKMQRQLPRVEILDKIRFVEVSAAN
jgi:hypothetical protein